MHHVALGDHGVAAAGVAPDEMLDGFGHGQTVQRLGLEREDVQLAKEQALRAFRFVLLLPAYTPGVADDTEDDGLAVVLSR